MKDFFKMLIASTLGVFIAGVILTILSIFIFAGIVATVSMKPDYTPEKQSVLKLELKGKINERQIENPLSMLMGSSHTSNGLNDILDAIKKAKENENIGGIYIKAENLQAGIATLEPIRKALLDFKETDKFIVAYGDYYTQGTYYLASVADKVIMNPQGLFDFHGLASHVEFYKGALEKMGVKMQVFKVGTFKSAVEPFMLDKMSEANKLQVSSFLNDIWGHLLNGISKSRNISIEDLNRYADEYMAFSDPKKVLEYHLIDELKYANGVEDYLKELLKKGKEDKVNMASVNDLKSIPFAGEQTDGDQIAVLYAEGDIIDRKIEGIYAPNNIIEGDEYAKELIKLRDKKEVKAIVFRINSGGGSAFASEQIWNAVKEVKKVKPIIVSMGDLAASGGYYIACEATSIVAEPTTLTGSIGIFGLIPEAEALSKRMGLSYDVVSTNQHSDLGASGIPFLGLPVKPFDESEKRMIQAYIERGYNTFVTRCAEGRSKTNAEIDSIGQGRVWTGKQALQLGLVDKIGNLDDAVTIAAKEAKLTTYSLENYPAQKDFFTQLVEESFGGVRIHILKTMLGSEKYEQTLLLKSLKSFDYRQAVMPYNIQK